MPDSIRIKEIHEKVIQIYDVLGCDERTTQLTNAQANTPGNTANTPVNLWYYNQRIARLLGVKVNVLTREALLYSPPQKIQAGTQVPPGWLSGQWGEHRSVYGAQDTEDGLIVELISNEFLDDPFNTGKAFTKSGDYATVNNILQLEKVRIDILDKALDLQNLSAFAIPNADNSGRLSKYEGLLSVVKEMAYMMSRFSEVTSSTLISSLVAQQITKEILAGLGLPVIMKTFGIRLSGKLIGRVPFPGLAKDAKSIVKYIGQILMNVGILVGQTVKDEERTKK